MPSIYWPNQPSPCRMFSKYFIFRTSAPPFPQQHLLLTSFFITDRLFSTPQTRSKLRRTSCSSCPYFQVLGLWTRATMLDYVLLKIRASCMLSKPTSGAVGPPCFCFFSFCFLFWQSLLIHLKLASIFPLQLEWWDYKCVILQPVTTGLVAGPMLYILPTLPSEFLPT